VCPAVELDRLQSNPLDRVKWKAPKVAELTLVALVGVWAIFYGVNEIFAAFALREAGRQAERLAG
jgi:uncharacterized membrane protein HdeD (DUF308 family)